MNKQLLKQAIREVIPSKDMREYLCEHADELDQEQVVDMISGAPVSLHKKLELFTELSRDEDLEEDLKKAEDDWERKWIETHSFFYRAKAVEKAIAGLRINGDQSFMVLRCERVDWAEDITDRRIFYTQEALEDYLKEERELKAKEESCCWYIIGKKVRNRNVITYLFIYGVIDGEICYFMDYEPEFKTDLYQEFWGCPDLNLPVPFRAGDIILVDGSPACEKKPALVLGVEDNVDCCCVCVLFVQKDGMLGRAPLKHSNMFYEIHRGLQISTLYRAQLFHGTLEGENAALEIARAFMGNSEHRGRCMERDICFEKLHASELTRELLEENVKL